jgi:phospholipid/cholesterol/gamma-HCH transport system substrate-binding protein
VNRGFRGSGPAVRHRIVVGFGLLVLVAVATVWYVVRGPADRHVTAHFTQSVGVYSGTEVRILGVRVGRVDDVHPQGTEVEVRMSLDGGVSVPAGARAVVVAPSVVSDRYVQLTPAYTGGAKLADGATIPASRTATPVELDELYHSINRLAASLGPDGANASGALSDLLDTSAQNLDGNGRALGNLIRDLGGATRTLSNSDEDFFATVDNLQKFTSMLAANDHRVVTAEQQLASVSAFLAEDRRDLGAALRELAAALDAVRGFIADNRAAIKSNVDKLATITQLLVEQRASLAEALDDVPLAVSNVLGAYDPKRHTLDGRGDLNEISMPALPLPAVGGGG